MVNFTQARADDARSVREGLYARLMAYARGLPNDDVLASMLASTAVGRAALPEDLGLGRKAYNAMLARHFPGAQWTGRSGTGLPSNERLPEREELCGLLMAHRAGSDPSEAWLAEIVTAACMGGNHLWQDLGLWARQDLSDLMTSNFPRLAAKNDRAMKWKKFLYKQLCVQEGIYTCRAPSCEVCVDYASCFGPEE